MAARHCWGGLRAEAPAAQRCAPHGARIAAAARTGGGKPLRRGRGRPGLHAGAGVVVRRRGRPGRVRVGLLARLQLHARAMSARASAGRRARARGPRRKHRRRQRRKQRRKQQILQVPLQPRRLRSAHPGTCKAARGRRQDHREGVHELQGLLHEQRGRAGLGGHAAPSIAAQHDAKARALLASSSATPAELSRPDRNCSTATGSLAATYTTNNFLGTSRECASRAASVPGPRPPRAPRRPALRGLRARAWAPPLVGQTRHGSHNPK